MKFNKFTIVLATIAAGLILCGSSLADSTNVSPIPPGIAVSPAGLPTGGQLAIPPDTNMPAPAGDFLGIPGANISTLLNKLPSASGFDTVKYSIELGVVTKNEEVLNSVKLDYYVKTNWMLGVEIQNAPGILNNASVFGGYRLQVTPSQATWVQALVRRTLVKDAAGTPPGTQAGLSVGYGMAPTDGGKVQIFTEGRLLSSPHGGFFTSKPPAELVAGAMLLLR